VGWGTEREVTKLTQQAPKLLDTTPDEQQRDWLRFADKLASYRHSFRASVKRLTIKEVAHGVNLAPESLDHQITRWDRRKKPSADSAFFLLDNDGQHRDEVAGMCGPGFIVTPKPKLSEGDALRALSDRAAKGYVSAQEVAQILGQTDFGGRKR
jgi:hypothetical protein